MDPAPLIARFAALMPAVDALVLGISDADARWKPASGAWSMLEIVCHLADEELEDFGPRLRATVRDPAQPWAPIDPEGWARERAYNTRNLASELERLRAARAGTLAWLPHCIAGADLSRAHHHASLGPIRAGDLLAAWAAHDLLHIRQLTKRRFELVSRDAAPFSTGYAGSWTS
jgi:hypothetical protein